MGYTLHLSITHTCCAPLIYCSYYLGQEFACTFLLTALRNTALGIPLVSCIRKLPVITDPQKDLHPRSHIFTSVKERYSADLKFTRFACRLSAGTHGSNSFFACWLITANPLPPLPILLCPRYNSCSWIVVQFSSQWVNSNSFLPAAASS